MTDEEYKRLKAMLDRIAEHQRRLSDCANDSEDSFGPVAKGIIELLAAAKERINNQIDGQRPPIDE